MANVKKLFIAAMVIGLIFTAITAFAQSAKEAIYALKKLEARVQSGISYRDYSSALGEAKFPVNMFIESADAKKAPELTASINKAMAHYEFVGAIWNAKFSSDNPYLKGGFIEEGSSLGLRIHELYPQAESEKNYYFADELFRIIWAEASKELKNTTNLSTITKGNKSNDCDKLKEENAKLKKQLELMKSKRNK